MLSIKIGSEIRGSLLNVMMVTWRPKISYTKLILSQAIFISYVDFSLFNVIFTNDSLQ